METASDNDDERPTLSVRDPVKVKEFLQKESVWWTRIVGEMAVGKRFVRSVWK